MKLYVGNLSFNTSNQDLNEVFGAIGAVESSSIIEDRETGRSRGFAFVEMSNPEEARAAIAAYDRKRLSLKVEPAVLATGDEIHELASFFEKPEGADEQLELFLTEVNSSRERTANAQREIDSIKVKIDSIIETL